MVTYVLNKYGQPLMPIRRCGKVRRLLNSGKAKVVRKEPFTIKLLFDTKENISDLTLGVDTGSSKIGTAVVDNNQIVLYTSEVKIRNDIDKLEKYETEKRGDLKNLLEQRRKIVTDLRNKCIELENKIYDLEQKNNKLFTQVKINEQEKIAFENRGKEQIKDIKRLKELEKVIFELKLTKEEIIKELEGKQKYLDNIKNGNDKKNNIEEIKEVKENEKTRSRNENQNDNLKSLENQENKDKN